MRFIKSVEIRNFRSIKSITKNLNLTDLNVFVGQNDNGKSNILRALNLFFNNQAEVGVPFRFDDEYCFHANSGTGSRKEIRIDLLIEPQKGRFTNAKTVKWTKKWKRDGSVIDTREYYPTGKPVPVKDNIYKWLDKLTYRYVPAVKGADYFNLLMGELHDVLTDSHGKLMANQGHGFISGIQKATSAITKELNSEIGIPNTIQVPSDFKVLFSNLDFGEVKGVNTYHLKRRGDGIKVRHIPIILKYMADQVRNISTPGFVKPDTIWGFEEPENNLEMKYAFELANTFREYSKGIQILVTTHSPAFYGIDVGSKGNIKKYHVNKNSELCTGINEITSEVDEALHEQMGLLPLITPYLQSVYEAQLKIIELETQLENLPPKVKCCVLTEDENSDPLKILLKANGFDMKRTEIFSYGGKDQLKGAITLGKYLKEKNSEIQLIVHRDSDYLSSQELASIGDSLAKQDIKFFHTKGVDIESHFLNVSHLKLLGLSLTDEDWNDFLKKATDQAYEDSIGKYFNYSLVRAKPEQNDYASVIANIKASYDGNQERYRYSKKVLGLLKSAVHKKTGITVNFLVESKGLLDPNLSEMAKIFTSNKN